MTDEQALPATLAALGLSRAGSELYLALLRQPTDPRLHETSSAALEELRELGLVSVREGRWEPAPPDAAVDAMIHRRLSALVTAHRAVPLLRRQYQQQSAAEPVEELVPTSTLSARVAQLVGPGPEQVSVAVRRATRDRWWAAATAGGQRSVRVIAERSAATGGELVPRHGAVRVLEWVPAEFAIVDGRLACLPAGDAAVVLTTAAPIVGALTALFDLLWDQAPPPVLSGAAHGTPLSADDQRLLALLAAGMKDDGIARQLGVARRTAQRRIHELGLRLGAHGRLEIVSAAFARGCLTPPQRAAGAGQRP